MTNEEKAALVGLCRIEIKRWKAASESNPNMRYMVNLMEIALSALTAEPVATPEGWRLVPVEPTEEMLAAWRKDMSLSYAREHAEKIGEDEIAFAYQAMLAAAPNP